LFARSSGLSIAAKTQAVRRAKMTQRSMFAIYLAQEWKTIVLL
jgi:hypothetical protein